MATHPDHSVDIDDHAGLAAWVDDDGAFHAAPEYQHTFRVRPSLFIGSLPCPGAHVSADPRALQAEFDAEAEAIRRAETDLRRAARATERWLSPLVLVAGLCLLFWMAVGIIAAAFGGRL